MSEEDAKIIGLLILVFFLLFFEACSYFHMKYVTELYCQSRYFNNVVKYEQCRHKDLVKLLQENQVIKDE